MRQTLSPTLFVLCGYKSCATFSIPLPCGRKHERALSPMYRTRSPPAWPVVGATYNVSLQKASCVYTTVYDTQKFVLRGYMRYVFDSPAPCGRKHECPLRRPFVDVPHALSSGLARSRCHPVCRCVPFMTHHRAAFRGYMRYVFDSPAVR